MIEEQVEALLRKLADVPEGWYKRLNRSDAVVWACARGLIGVKRRRGARMDEEDYDLFTDEDPKDPSLMYRGPLVRSYVTGYWITSLGREWLVARQHDAD